MKKPEWFPFYVGDFTSSSDVEMMSTEAVGAYILLLCKAWHQDPMGTLPEDDTCLSRWARVRPARWQQIKLEIMRAFTLTDGRWHQVRMMREAEKACNRLGQKVAAGKRSAESRNVRSTNVQSDGHGSLEERSLNAVGVVVVSTSSEEIPEPNNSNNTGPIERSLNGRSDVVTLKPAQVELYRVLVQRPEWLDTDTWIDPVAARDIVRLPTTTMRLIQDAIAKARKAKRTGLRNPAGLAIKLLRSPDPGLLEALAAQEGA